MALYHDDVIKWKHFRVTGQLCGEFAGPGEFPAQRPMTRSFDVFFDMRLNKRSSKQPWGWWFETPSWSLWRHCNDEVNTNAFGIVLDFVTCPCDETIKWYHIIQICKCVLCCLYYWILDPIRLVIPSANLIWLQNLKCVDKTYSKLRPTYVSVTIRVSRLWGIQGLRRSKLITGRLHRNPTFYIGSIYSPGSFFIKTL